MVDAGIDMKDLVWNDRQPDNVPLGQGLISPKFAEQKKEALTTVPVSIHVECLEQAGIPENIAALRNDLAALATWLSLVG